ncbi:biofilm formation protein PelB [Pseudomonas aeruginosa VRFPA09]|nr:biofilm formation protein PelB [Pseudomonas aeruginosa VRFPA09]
MANSPAADKHPKARLLNPWALLPVALGVALVLWLTFNSEEVFMPSGDGEPDAVSVNYAELLLQAHPENDALRLTLIDLLVKLGDFEQARHHLALLRGKDRLATPFYEVELDILGALARPEGMDEEQTRRLLERLRKIEHVSLNDAMLERLARHALALDAPDLAARTFAELAGRDPQGRAWEVGQELLALRPQDRTLLADLARLGEWTGNGPQALGLWKQLLAGADDAALREHAWRLSLQMFDFDSAIELLAPIGAQRQMTDEELDALVYSHETRGTPEEGEAWLRGYVQGYPKQRLAWQRLQQILEHTQQLQEETGVWARMARHFPLSVKERMQWAETHWNLFDPRQAWKVLAGVDTRAIREPEFWRLRAALAWALEQDDDARAAYERMLALDIRLNSSDEDQLIALYRDSNPQQALQVLIGSWQRSRDPRRLASALQLAENLHDWPALKSLLAEAEGLPEAQGSPYYWVARARLAEQEGHGDVAERLYREALVRFPGENLVRERLLWFYIDRGRRDSLAPLLAQWHGLALRDSTLWLPFASASLLLERNDQALAWFRLYLKSNPNDWLVQAAYADALDASGYQDKALRLRRQLLRRLDREAVRAWFEQFLDQLAATNQEPLKDDWLAWARGQGLKIGRNEEILAALRSQNRAALQRLLERGELDPAQRVEALVRLGHGGEALGEALGALGDGHSRDNREQLRRQAAEILERTPQGLQLGWNKRDFGGLDFKGPTLRAARHLGDDWYADLELGSGRYHGDALDSSLLGSERNARLTLRRELADGFAAATLDGSWRDDEDRHGLGLLRNWRLSARDELEAGLDWHRETDETGLMRALGMRDSVKLGGRHTLSGRDQLSWSLAHNRFSTRQGDDLGNGEALSLEWAHTLFFDGPAWQLRGGIDYQRNRLENRLPDDLLAAHGGALALDGARSQDLLQDRYGQVYLGSTWRRGFPGALNRSRPQYTWIVDTLAGWQWTEKEFNYGIDLGIGMELLGDDELAFTFGYQSAPQGGGGDAGGTLGVTYSTRFGR